MGQKIILKNNTRRYWFFYIINSLFALVFSPIIFSICFNINSNQGWLLADIQNKATSPRPTFGANMITTTILLAVWLVGLIWLGVIHWKNRSIDQIANCNYFWIIITYVLTFLMYLFSILVMSGSGIYLLTATDGDNIGQLNATGIIFFVLIFLPYVLFITQFTVLTVKWYKIRSGGSVKNPRHI